MLSWDVFLPCSETLEAERALIEERYEDKITNLQKHLKKFYTQELKVSAVLSGVVPKGKLHISKRTLYPVWFYF